MGPLQVRAKKRVTGEPGSGLSSYRTTLRNSRASPTARVLPSQLEKQAHISVAFFFQLVFPTPGNIETVNPARGAKGSARHILWTAGLEFQNRFAGQGLQRGQKA